MRPALDTTTRGHVARSLLAISRDLEPRLLRTLHESGHPGLRPSFARFLYLVWDEPRPLNVIADELGISRQAVSHTARLVEQAGYAERRPNPDDGRSKLVVVTPKGRAVDDEVGRRAIHECEAHYESLVGEATLRVLTTGLGELRDGLGASPARPAPERASIGVLPLVALQARAAVVAAVAGEGHPDVKPSHHEVLPLLRTGARATDVARMQGVTRQTSSATLQELATLGYLERRTDRRDLRNVMFALTERGADLLESQDRALAAVERRFGEVLGARRFDELVTAAGALATALQLEAAVDEVAASGPAHDLAAVAARLRDVLGPVGAGRLAGMLVPS